MSVSEPSVGRELVYQIFESIRFIKMSMGIRCCTVPPTYSNANFPGVYGSIHTVNIFRERALRVGGG